MKIYIVGEVFDTNKMEASDVKWKLQRRLFQWLGLDPNGKFNYKVDSVSYLSPNKVEFKFSRHYGDYYDKNHPDCIFSYDKQILLGDGYLTGFTADFSQHPGRYIIWHHIDSFVDEYNMTIKVERLRCSKLKSIEVSQDQDQITITYETNERKQKNPQTIQNGHSSNNREMGFP